MPAISGGEPSKERPGRAADDAQDKAQATSIPKWAPVEPLPSSEMFLATFAGVRPVAGRDILDPAFDLVACHREERLAEATLIDQTASLEELRVAGKSLVSARTDIAMLVTIIDEAVRERLLHRRNQKPRLAPLRTVGVTVGTVIVADRSGVPVHTESVGEVAARMAELWEILDSAAADPEEHPETLLLAELCDGYDCLAAEIEIGRRLPPGL